ncbi:hypothetical protein [Xanthomonas sp. NCPPB 2632]|uniref:hypothetical protein n=1 Tax=Xanthomonas sp. NCPPB 2632 TaxID=3240912 RepID=UPI00351508E8
MNIPRAEVIKVFETKWSSSAPNHALVQESLAKAFDKFVAEQLADKHFIQELVNGTDASFAQRLGEIQLAMRMTQAGFSLSSGSKGPDLLATKDGQRIWLELITPEPKGIPAEWVNPKNGVFSFPHEKILLRWTAAIREKATKGQRYLEQGVIGAGEPYVIVVNDTLLNARPGFLHGISQKPFAVEATLAVGPLQMHIDRTTLEAVSTDHQHRPHITNHNKAQVPADTFFDPAYKHVSAVMGVTFAISDICRDAWVNHLVHNPRAVVPLAHGCMPAEEEWACTESATQYSVYQV